MGQIVEVSPGNYAPLVVPVMPVSVLYNAIANSSSKVFVVPANEMWDIAYVSALFTTTTAAGNRVLQLEIQDATLNVIATYAAAIPQIKSVTRRYNWLPGGVRETAANSGELLCSIPMSLFLPSGYTVKLHDSAVIDALADDLTVSVGVRKYTG